jgi:hypothetical protein
LSEIERIEAISKYSNLFFTNGKPFVVVIPYLSFSYSEKALSKSKQLGSKYCEARSLNNLRTMEANRSNYAGALNYYLESLAIKNKHIL